MYMNWLLDSYNLGFDSIYPVEGRSIVKNWASLEMFISSQTVIQCNFPSWLWISSYFSKQIGIFGSVVVEVKSKSLPLQEEWENSYRMVTFFIMVTKLLFFNCPHILLKWESNLHSRDTICDFFKIYFRWQI